MFATTSALALGTPSLRTDSVCFTLNRYSAITRSFGVQSQLMNFFLIIRFSKAKTLFHFGYCTPSHPCGFSKPVRPVVIELFLSALDRSTTNGSPNPDEDSVSCRAMISCRMHLVMWQLLRLTTIFLRCVPGFFRSRNEQALVELALRQQLAAFTLKGPKPRITLADRTF